MFDGLLQYAHQIADVADNIRKSLDQASLKDVSVSQDRDKGVVTLAGTTGQIPTRLKPSPLPGPSLAPGCSNEIAVRPANDSSMARKVDSDLDSAIDKNLHAVLVKNRLEHAVKYDVKNGVVTLSGTVNSQSNAPKSKKWPLRSPMFSSGQRTASEESKGDIV